MLHLPDSTQSFLQPVITRAKHIEACAKTLCGLLQDCRPRNTTAVQLTRS